MRKIIALFLGMILATFSITGVFAQTLTDVKGHWGEQYINDVVAKGLATGYTDGTFLPDGSTTRIEAVIFASNMYPDSKIQSVYNESKDKWTSKLRENNIPSWADKYMVFGLEIGIYPESFLKHFMDDSKNQNLCLRYEFVTFMVNALGFKSDFVENPTLAFKDVSSINDTVLPYVEVMVRKGIIVGTGTFNPTDKLTRAQVAVILSNSYKFSAKAGASSGPTETLSKTATIESMVISNNIATIKLLDSDGNTSSYTATTSGTSVLSNGNTVDLLNLKIGQTIKIQYTGNTISKIEINNESTVVAEFISYSSLEMSVLVDGGVVNYEINPSLTFTKGSKTVSVLDLIAGEEVTLTIQNDTIVKGVVTTFNKMSQGVIVSIANNEMQVQETTGVFAYYIDNTANMTIDGVIISNISNLSVGDSISATIVNSEVTNLSAKTVQSTIKSVALTGINQSSSENVLTFKDEDGALYSFKTTADTTYILKGKSKSLSSMELGFECDIIVKGGKLLTVETQGEYRLIKLNGVVEAVDIKNYTLVITDSAGDEYKITVESDTIINAFNSSDKKTIKNIYEGDNVVIEGVDNNLTILASKIIFWS